MKKWLPILAGFFAGLTLGGWLFSLNPRPAFSISLAEPAHWIFTCLQKHLPIQNESLGGLVIGIPLWLIYWGCLGSLVGLLVQLLFLLFRKMRHRNDAKRNRF